MERAADQKRRHFMRVLLVLQGLLDRTPALLPLPEGGASFLRLRDQDDGRIVLLNDADDARLLGTGAERFRDYQRRLNAQLRPGMRIIADFRADGFRRLRQDWHRNHPRISPTSVYEFPAHDVPHLIEGRRDGGLLIRFARTEKVERRNVPVPGRPGYVYRSALVEPTRRASCLVFPEDSWVLPFDLVQVHELEAFLASRDERSESFLSMVPTVRAAIAAKRAEAAEEAPFRELLRQELIRAGAAEADVDRTMDELVHWWKTSNLWCRPLNGDREHEARAGRRSWTSSRAGNVRRRTTAPMRWSPRGEPCPARSRSLGTAGPVEGVRAGTGHAGFGSDGRARAPGRDDAPPRRHGGSDGARCGAVAAGRVVAGGRVARRRLAAVAVHRAPCRRARRGRARSSGGSDAWRGDRAGACGGGVLRREAAGGGAPDGGVLLGWRDP